MREKRNGKTAGKTPKVQETLRETLSANQTVKGNKTKPDSLNVLQMLEELCKEMQQMFLDVMEASPRPLGLNRRVKGCKKCKEEGMGENCSNCFKCCQEGHFSR